MRAVYLLNQMNFQEAAADFRQNLSDNTSGINKINTQSSVSNIVAHEILRLELIDLAKVRS